MRARRYQSPKGQEQGEPLRCNDGVTSQELPPKFALPDPVPIPSRPDPVLNKDSCAKPEPSQPELALQPQQAAVGVDDGQAHKSQPDAAGKEKPPIAMPKPQVAKQIALTLFGELQAARKRCNPAVKMDPLKANSTHTAEIERCLRSGVTADQIRHVIACWEALVKAGKRDREHFNSVTPFRASNVAQYIEMTLEDAAKPRVTFGKPDASPPKPAPKPKQPDEFLLRVKAHEEEVRKAKESQNKS